MGDKKEQLERSGCRIRVDMTRPRPSVKRTRLRVGLVAAHAQEAHRAGEVIQKGPHLSAQRRSYLDKLGRRS